MALTVAWDLKKYSTVSEWSRKGKGGIVAGNEILR